MELDPKLLEILACPKCKGDLEPHSDEEGLVCRSCNLVFPVKKGIPVMLIEETRPFTV